MTAALRKYLSISSIYIRTPEAYAGLALPGSVNIPMGELFGKDWITLLFQRHVKKVIVADNAVQEHTGYLLLQELGYENLAVLDGGLESFNATILNPDANVPQNTR